MCKIREMNLETAKYYGYEAQSNQLVEEIADVELMLEQIKYLLQIPEDELLAVKTFKVNRTRERMESSK